MTVLFIVFIIMIIKDIISIREVQASLFKYFLSFDLYTIYGDIYDI